MDIREPFIQIHDNQPSKNELYEKILRDPEVKESILKNINYPTITVESDVINKIDNIRNFDSKLKIKYNDILTNIEALNNRYLENKRELEKIIVNNNNIPQKIDKFNKKNIIIKKKILDFKNSLDSYVTNYGKNIKILKNIKNNKELMLKKANTDTNNNVLYFLIINNSCLRSISRGKYKIDNCNKIEPDFLFYIRKIESNVDYNTYITDSKISTNNDLIPLGSTEINYPFYMIIPLELQGFAIQYRSYINNCLFKKNCSKKSDKLVSIRPISNNPFQRFNIVQNSSACN